MKKIIIASLFLFALCASAAGQDTTKKKSDTVTVQVPVYEKQDTITNSTFTAAYEKNGEIRLVEGGSIILKGFARQNKEGNWQWTHQPKVVGGLDHRGRKVHRVVQIL